MIEVGIGAILGAIIGLTPYQSFSDKVIPTQKQVQETDILPNLLELKCLYLNQNRFLETTKINTKSYLLKDIDGESALFAYEIK